MANKNNKKTLLPKEDLISNIPMHVIDKIFKRLPLKYAAKMSILSRHWRSYWLSYRYLIFDEDFWEGQRINTKNSLFFERNMKNNFDWEKTSNIISSVLLHHIGPVHKFELCIPEDRNYYELQRINLSQCFLFLSKNQVHEIVLDYCYVDELRMPSYIYDCKELVKLTIDCVCPFVLSPPPSDFKGFVHLRSLQLLYASNLSVDVFQSFVANCPGLTELMLADLSWIGTSKLVINVPSLKTLIIHAEFEYLGFKNVHRLTKVSLRLTKQTVLNSKIVDAVKMFASSCKLRALQLGTYECQFLAAVGITKVLTLSKLQFNHLRELWLTKINLGDYKVICFTFGMLQSCPFIKLLSMNVITTGMITLQGSTDNEFDYNKNYMLGHLRKVVFKGFPKSDPVLKLLEYVFAIAKVLEEIILVRYKNKPSTYEIFELPDLLQIPRSSSKAKLYYLDI